MQTTQIRNAYEHNKSGGRGGAVVNGGIDPAAPGC